MIEDYHSQHAFEIRLEWGAQGLQALSASESVVIVDVLSFSTCVDIVVDQGGQLYPYPYKDETAERFARDAGLQLASISRSKEVPSLASCSLVNIGPLKLVLPSPNGSSLSVAVRGNACYTACLRNANAVAKEVSKYSTVAVIASGERWPDGSIRFALEDLIGAGAVIAKLTGGKSPEALLAQQAFEASRPALQKILLECASGRELVERGFREDVVLAGEIECSQCVPMLSNGCYSNVAAEGSI